MKVSAQYARDHFDELLLATENGEEVEVSREGKPSIRLFIVPAPVQPSATGERKLGMGRGIFLPDVDDQWQRMKEEDEQYFADHSLMTTGEI